MAKMTLHTFIHKINWRQILIHFVATWFFIYSFQQLAYLTNPTEYEGVEILVNSGDKKASEFLTKNNIGPGQFVSYAFYASEAWVIGLVIAFIISLIISRRRKWFWVNSLIVFFVAFVLKRLHSLGWIYLKQIFLEPGHLFIFNSTALYLLTNGLLLLLLGILAFSFRPFNDFIEKNRLAIENH
jgi:hypothetical protein